MNKINNSIPSKLQSVDIAQLQADLSRSAGLAPYTNIGGIEIHSDNDSDDNIIVNDIDNFYNNVSENGYKLDWLAFTFDDIYEIDKVLNSLNYDIEEFDLCSGRYFYNSGITLSNYVNVYFNDDKIEKYNGSSDTVNIVFTGQGCTDLYARNNGELFSVFKIMSEINVKVTRIDIAYDDFYGLLNFEKIKDKLKKGEYRSSKKSYDIVETSNTNGFKLGETIYIGNRKYKSSNGTCYARLYNKKAQYEQKKQLLPKIVERTGIWQRYELSYTKKKANDVFYSLICGEYYQDIDRLYKATFRNIIEFLNCSTKKNKNRWTVCKWWDDFLQLNEKIQFINHERDADISRMLEWITTAVMPNIKVLELIFHEFDIDIYQLMKCYHNPNAFSKKQLRLYNNTIKMDKNELYQYIKEYFKIKVGDANG